MAAEVFGTRQRNGLYRVFFITQSLVSFAVLSAYVRSQPGREIYCVTGPVSWLMRGGQLAGVVMAVCAARRVGITRMIGAESASAWFRNEQDVPPEPEAQGPAPGPDGRMDAGGPFAFSRHPLNLSPLPVFWLNPRMTTNLLAFNLAATAYLVIGSLHEEARLRAAYGDAYAAYQRSGVPFYFPTWKAAATPVEGPARQPLPEPLEVG